MSKSKTTGFPQQPKNDPKRKFKSRSEREAEVNRLVLLFAGILGAVIGVILGVALLIDGVLQPLTPVANVGGTSITTRDFQNRTRFERWRVGSELYNIYQVYGEQALTDNQGGFFSSTTQLFQQLAVPSQFGQRVLDQMIDNLLIRQYADANGISVADAEIDNQAFEDLLGHPHADNRTVRYPHRHRIAHTIAHPHTKPHSDGFRDDHTDSHPDGHPHGNTGTHGTMADLSGTSSGIL
jgi:hypothetical protein